MAEPLHDWYPYLEGYSPDFVNSVLDTFAPNARRVIDPFAGTGTTPLSVAKRGGLGLYCELNPLLQFLVETKADAVVQSARQREALVGALESLSASIRREVALQEADSRLLAAYAATFGESEFFPEPTLGTVLKLRTWLDTIACVAPEAGAVATVGWGTTMHRTTDAALPYWDAYILVFSLIAQWLQARKILENWAGWVGVNTVAIGVYWVKDLRLTAGLYLVFWLMALWGWREWRKSMKGAV